MKKKISIENLKDVSETLLFPLLSRNYESRLENGIIKDQKSVEILNGLDYDETGYKLYTISRIGVCLRTVIFDDEVNKFLEKNSDSVIVNLGCGLDTRYPRINNGKILWYDIDFPDIIELRKNFFKESDRHKFISGSVLDDLWIDKIPKKKPVLFIAEGLCFYFTEDENKKLLGMLKDNFPGAELLMETFHPMYVKSIKKKEYENPGVNRAAQFLRWGVKSGKELESWFDEIEFLKERFVIREDVTRFPRGIRILFGIIPVLKKATKIVHLKFKG